MSVWLAVAVVVVVVVVVVVPLATPLVMVVFVTAADAAVLLPIATRRTVVPSGPYTTCGSRR